MTELFFDLVPVGSPLGLFLHIEQAQIVPRRGRERTMEAPVGLALDRAGRFGCFSCDRLYNIFEPADPVAYMLNSTVDASLGRKVDPISIPSATQSTLDSVFGSFSELAKSLPALPDLPSLPTPVGSLVLPLPVDFSADSFLRSSALVVSTR